MTSDDPSKVLVWPCISITTDNLKSVKSWTFQLKRQDLPALKNILPGTQAQNTCLSIVMPRLRYSRRRSPRNGQSLSSRNIQRCEKII